MGVGGRKREAEQPKGEREDARRRREVGKNTAPSEETLWPMVACLVWT